MSPKKYDLKLTLIVLLLGISATSWAQKTILWKIELPDSTHKSYLLGTFHQIGNSFVDSLPEIKNLLYSSDIAFFESVDPIDSLRNELNKRRNSYEWREKLRKADVKFLIEHTKGWSVPIEKLTPIELYIKLNQDYVLHTCGSAQPDDEWSHFDKYLIHLAKQKEIDVKGLETDSIQTKDINVLGSDYGWDDAKGDIKTLVRNIKKSKTKTAGCHFAQAYMNFELTYAFNENCTNQNMIRRNNLWMPIIVQSIQSNNTFIAVGVQHLYGRCGLISQLRQKGYIVEPIKMNNIRPK